MSTVTVDRDVCENHGQCTYAAPAVFSFDDDENLVYVADPAAEQEHDVLAAAAACPVRAIIVGTDGAGPRRLSNEGGADGPTGPAAGEHRP